MRRLLTALFMATALFVGQQAAALHALAHATEQVGGKQDKKSPSPSCEQCSLYSQLTGAAAGGMPPVAAPCAATEAPPVLSLPAGACTRLAFRSRAPPLAS